MKFLTIFGLTTVVSFSLLYGLILGVDPYNKYGNNIFKFETKAVDFARANKFNQVEYGKKEYDAFILGSSSAHRYSTHDLNALTGLTSYNYSTQSATPEDYIAMTRHILTRFKPKLLIISMDFEALNKRTKTDEMFFSSPLKDYLDEVPPEESLFNNTYLTLEAVRDSFKVILVNNFGNPRHTYLEDGNYKLDKPGKKLRINQFMRAPFEVDEKRLGYLREIKALCQEHKTKIVVLTSPLSMDHLKRITENNELNSAHRIFKQALIEIFDELWDFQNETMEPYSSIEYFIDSNHPNHKLSSIILKSIFGNEAGPGIALRDMHQ
jgi:hypothetical protein